jgi:hypothetical protein
MILDLASPRPAAATTVAWHGKQIQERQGRTAS